MVAQVVIYTGSIISSVFSAAFGRYFREKTILMLILLLGVVGMVITLLSPTLEVATVGLFIVFASKGMQTGTAFSYLSQTTSENIRVRYTLWLCLALACGVTFVGPAFALLQPW